MKEAVNMVKLVGDLPKRRRGKACIVLTQNAGDQKAWADELASQTEAKHLDLLDLFAEDEALGGKMSTFGVDDLFALLQQDKDVSVLIVTGLEFLRASWSGRASAMEQFANRIEFWEKKPSLVFVTQHDSFLVKHRFGRHTQNIYVVDQRETLAL